MPSYSASKLGQLADQPMDSSASNQRAGVVIGLLCWHRKRRLRYIFLSNARRHKEADHKPRALFSSDTMRSANGSVNARPESHELPNAFRNAASVPWSSAGSRRGATTPGHHELEMNIMVSLCSDDSIHRKKQPWLENLECRSSSTILLVPQHLKMPSILHVRGFLTN